MDLKDNENLSVQDQNIEATEDSFDLEAENFSEKSEICDNEIISNDKNEDVFYNLLLKNQRRKDILKDEDLISVEESNKRIILFQIVFGLIFLVVVVWEMGSLRMIKSNQNIVIWNILQNETQNKISLSHLAIVNDQNEVYDFSLNDEKSGSKGRLFRLPKHISYFVYSDLSNYLYFLDRELQKPVVKYDGNRHEVIHVNEITIYSQQSFELKPIISQSLNYGNLLWLFGVVDNSNVYEHYEHGCKLNNLKIGIFR